MKKRILITFIILLSGFTWGKPRSTLNPNTVPKAGDSLVWSPLFHVVWDQVQLKNGSKIVKVEPPNPIIKYLEKSELNPDQVLPKDIYNTYVGPASEVFINQTLQEVYTKFRIVIPKDRFEVSPTGNIGIGVLSAKLDFKKKFYSSNGRNIQFEASDGKKELVSYFGSRAQYSGLFSGLVKILHYNEEVEEFAIDIETNREGEKIILYQPHEKASIQEAIKKVGGFKTPAKDTKSVLLEGLNDDDVLKIPYISLKADTNFTNLLGGVISYENGQPGRSVTSVFQSINFKLTEKGARVKIVAFGGDDIFGSIPKPKRKPKKLVFNKPFFLFLWKDGADSPYLALWIDDASFLKE